ncbi:RidA family protein [Novipirellula artificiosorum]|uniref:Endoribonuclease L-PSP n=1 Tax=Novipirellula artificiosorum TaxID=2528016 RepID=A0A5C6E4N6_9BACT|nr:RidA family protein [Novipirellula artificiosorum]TWU42396.1 Endoribonuclease L-PSP [Novipirellula artificiosorum]
MNAESKLNELGIKLQPAPKPLGLYKPIIVVGPLAYLSGHGPLKANNQWVTGRLGLDMDVSAGYDASRLTGLAMLSTLRAHLGTLDRVKRVVKLVGLVRCTNGFDKQAAVINGCSELFRDVFGDDAGVGARSAIGAKSLPGNMAVEIEAIFEVETD